jgi:hypothetical protein
MMRIYSVFIVLAILIQVVAAQETDVDWKLHVIPTKDRAFDFKTVPKGMVPVHHFVLTNPLLETLHIKSITSSCTCTTIDFDVTNEDDACLKTYEKAVIPVRLQGDQFEGQRNATITVVIDQPSNAEIQLNITGEIRTDLSIVPRDFIDFGNVELGKGQSRTLTVTYTGSNTQWRLVDTKCDSTFIRTEMTSETLVGKKTFKINVILDGAAPHGRLDALLTLLSNDAENRREIPIPVRATVGTVITVSPPHLSLGVLSPGEASPMKNVSIRGTKPFRITGFESDNPAIEVPLTINADDPPKIIYAVPILYRNPAEGEGAAQEGVLRASVRVTTNIPGLTPTFFVTASVRE